MLIYRFQVKTIIINKKIMKSSSKIAINQMNIIPIRLFKNFSLITCNNIDRIKSKETKERGWVVFKVNAKIIINIVMKLDCKYKNSYNRRFLLKPFSIIFKYHLRIWIESQNRLKMDILWIEKVEINYHHRWHALAFEEFHIIQLVNLNNI